MVTRRPAQLAAVLLLALAAAGCGGGPAHDSHETAGSAPPVGGLAAHLRDEVHPRPGNRIAWSTRWTLCWAPYPGARGYELETLTGEGASPTLQRQPDRCLGIEAASGENRRSDGLRNRRVLLALQSVQLAYRVRAILGDGVSNWSPAIAVGEPTEPAQAPR